MKTLRQRLLPAPLTSAVSFVAWLLLNSTLDPAHLLLAAILAVALPLLLAPLRPDPPQPRSWATVLRLTAIVLWDVVVSAWQVARAVLGPQARLKPGFVWVPLDLTSPHGIAVLGAIITMTPGTLTADLSLDRKYLLVHGLDVGDEAELIRSIKERYERPLLEIFG